MESGCGENYGNKEDGKFSSGGRRGNTTQHILWSWKLNWSNCVWNISYYLRCGFLLLFSCVQLRFPHHLSGQTKEKQLTAHIAILFMACAQFRQALDIGNGCSLSSFSWKVAAEKWKLIVSGVIEDSLKEVGKDWCSNTLLNQMGPLMKNLSESAWGTLPPSGQSQAGKN